MSASVTNQRGTQFDRTLETTLGAVGAVTAAISAKSITVTASGEGAVELKVRRHPATQEMMDRPVGPPDGDSPHWGDAAPDDPLVGTLAAGSALVAAYEAAGFAWWSVELVSGGPVTVFVSVDGIALL